MASMDLLFMGMMITCGVFTLAYVFGADAGRRSKVICCGWYGLSFGVEALFPETPAMLLMQIVLTLYYAFWMKINWFA